MGILRKKPNHNLKTYPSDNFQLLQPWSVPILKTVLPENILKSFLDLSEQVLNDPNSKSYGHQLAGEIQNEKYIDSSLIDFFNLKPYLTSILNKFIVQCKMQMFPELSVEKVKKNSYIIELCTMWIVNQRPGEYNPLHMHNDTISSVLYLKVPNKLPPIKNKDSDGSIVFYNAGTRDLEFSRTILKCEPKVGELYIFGSNQQHAVYPYRSNDLNAERISISFNANFTDMPGNTILG